MANTSKIIDLNTAKKMVDLFIDCNLGLFGLALPKDFITIGNNKDIATVVSAILSTVSFPSLNILYSAAGRFREKSETNLVADIRVTEMEIRIDITPLDENGNEIKSKKINLDEQGKETNIKQSVPLKVLGINPFKTKAVKVIEKPGEKEIIVPVEDSNALTLKPDVNSIISTLLDVAGGIIGIPGVGTIPKSVLGLVEKKFVPRA